MRHSDNKKWANAVATRLVDEIDFRDDFPDDAKKLQAVLERLFSRNPWAINALVGTAVIEEGYFEKIN